jgi:hypothetical protein
MNQIGSKNGIRPLAEESIVSPSLPMRAGFTLYFRGEAGLPGNMRVPDRGLKPPHAVVFSGFAGEPEVSLTLASILSHWKDINP